MIKHGFQVPLFVPGDRPDRFAKAAASGTDAVILDLEDGVTLERKVDARRAVASHGVTSFPVIIRINPLGTEAAAADLPFIKAALLVAVMVAKAESTGQLQQLANELPRGTFLLPLIETAAGVANVRAIAALPFVSQLGFGSIDLALDLGCADTFEAHLMARSEVVLASRLGSCAPPLDGVTPSIDDAALITADARRARAIGFGGKMLIHPKQIAPTREAFRPTDAEIAEARAIVAVADKFGTGAIAHEGRMVDMPVIERARRLLEQLKSPGQS